jgi:hypothetical protein
MIRYSTIYRVEVTVPNAVWERFGHTKEYEQFAASLSNCVETSGQHTYAEAIEWAEAPTHTQCATWADAWATQLSKWLIEDARMTLNEELT